MSSEGRLRIGTSGYDYPHWDGTFYPGDLPADERFDFYTTRFDCVEINNTFYHLPKSHTFRRWHDRAPPGFRYALKFSRFGTHLKHLKDPEDTVPRFLDRAQALQSFLGPILVQLPPNWRANPERLDAFLRVAPKRHRWAVEVRDPDWLREEVFAVLESHGAALVIHDALDDHPWRLTTDWTYCRFHASAGEYSSQWLVARARDIRQCLEASHDVWAFFNNDRKTQAPVDAERLREYVSG